MSPNILWLMTDEQRTDSLGGYGSDWAHSPNLDRLCQDGVVFENAWSSTNAVQRRLRRLYFEIAFRICVS